MNIGSVKLRVMALRSKLLKLIEDLDNIEDEILKPEKDRKRCPKCGVRDVRLNLNGIVCRACGFSDVPKRKKK